MFTLKQLQKAVSKTTYPKEFSDLFVNALFENINMLSQTLSVNSKSRWVAHAMYWVFLTQPNKLSRQEFVDGLEVFLNALFPAQVDDNLKVVRFLRGLFPK